MTDPLTPDQLTELSAFVATRLGLNIPSTRWHDLERQTISAAEEFGFSSATVFLNWLFTTPTEPKQIEMLASHLTVAETYFWREPKFLEALRDTILPELIRRRQTGGRSLRLWSAGCASGEEPYSLAIILRELLPDLADWHISLLATDINPRILQRAALGLYSNWSFRNVPAGFKEKYFSRRADDRYEILPEIRKMVTFAYLNLAEAIYPSTGNNTQAMDLILCRNVLMYFVPERAREVGQHFYEALSEEGWLVVGASELSQQLFPQFAPVPLAGVFLYRRSPPPASAPPAVMDLPASTVFQANPENGFILPARDAAKIKNETPPPAVVPVALTVRNLANQGNLSEARLACERALAADSLDAPLHYLHALIFQEQALDDDARAALKRALYLDPGFVLAHFSLGNLAQRQSDPAGAQKHFENALELLRELDPDETLPEADGLSAGRLAEVIRASLQAGGMTR